MGVPWGRVLKVGAAIAGAVFPGVSAIEDIAKSVVKLTGKEKQNAVLELVKATLASSEQIAARDLLDDAEVEKAARGVIDAYVALQNVLATKTAAATS